MGRPFVFRVSDVPSRPCGLTTAYLNSRRRSRPRRFEPHAPQPRNRTVRDVVAAARCPASARRCCDGVAPSLIWCDVIFNGRPIFTPSRAFARPGVGSARARTQLGDQPAPDEGRVWTRKGGQNWKRFDIEVSRIAPSTVWRSGRPSVESTTPCVSRVPGQAMPSRRASAFGTAGGDGCSTSPCLSASTWASG